MYLRLTAFSIDKLLHKQIIQQVNEFAVFPLFFAKHIISVILLLLSMLCISEFNLI